MTKVGPAPEDQNVDHVNLSEITSLPPTSSASNEQILDPTNLPETTSLPPTSSVPPRELPKHLADFKEYVDSKFCYYAEPIVQAEIVDVQRKVAYQCHMKILVEERSIHWSEKPHYWGNETFFGSRTLGRLVESTVREGEGMANMWDYNFALPSTDKKSKQKRNLPEGNYLTRCSNCRGKCFLTCKNYDCRGDGRVDGGTKYCSECRGTGQIRCSSCKGLGGFLHSPTLHVEWHTRKSTWYCQNSYLPDKRIRKGTRRLFWSTGTVPWSKSSLISNVVESIVETTPDIDLKMSVRNHYNDKHLRKIEKKDNAMRRLECIIERMDFEEIKYTMGENYVNKQDSNLGNTFRFCQYPGPKGQQVIYENDYPLNCCGCFGEKTACYSCCCTIL